VGVGHSEAVGERYAKPYAAMVEYLDQLDDAGVPKERRLLAALGPKMLKLAADRSAGAHPYLTTPEHTRRAREILGSDALLAPEHKVVVSGDADRDRAVGRPAVAHPYLGLANYVNNLRSLGYGDDDLAGEGSDRLIDDLVLHGEAPTVAAGLREHLDAGANHVVIHQMPADGIDLLKGYEALAAQLLRE
jgi:probable F420-dependent oxidoreductase